MEIQKNEILFQRLIQKKKKKNNERERERERETRREKN